MKVAVKTINEFGLNEIHAFLAENHKLGGEHFNNEMLIAWAQQAEFSLSEGNAAGIEIQGRGLSTWLYTDIHSQRCGDSY